MSQNGGLSDRRAVVRESNSKPDLCRTTSRPSGVVYRDGLPPGVVVVKRRKSLVTQGQLCQSNVAVSYSFDIILNDGVCGTVRHSVCDIHRERS